MATAWESSRLPRRLRSRWARLGLALGLIIAASLGRMALGLVDARLPPFSLYVPAILLATLFGGWKTGAAATGLALALTWVLFVRPWTGPGFSPAIAWIDMALYAASAASIVAVAEY